MQYIPPINGDTGNPNRSYVNANPSLGVEGSIPPAEAFEHVIREVVNAITAAGLTPSGANLTQLAAAIAANSSPDATETVKGKVELATNAEAIGGTDTTRAVTSAGIASSKSLAANGYMKLPGGLILQWGTIAHSTTEGTSVTVTFPVAFPTACRSVTANDVVSDKAAGISVYNIAASGASFFIWNRTGGTAVGTSLNWFAIGY